MYSGLGEGKTIQPSFQKQGKLVCPEDRRINMPDMGVSQDVGSMSRGPHRKNLKGFWGHGRAS